MKIFIIAGEASGDLHGSNLCEALKTQIPKVQLQGWGGELMKAKGVEIKKHYAELAFMGFVEVIMNLRTILGNIKLCKKEIEDFKPDAIIFVDYPGFNLRIAQWARNKKYKTIYYISPQVWAWKSSRVFKIKKYIDLMLTILPFEDAFYKKFNYESHFVGHPLLDAIKKFNTPNKDFFLKENNLSTAPIIAILPGSRKQEIDKILHEAIKVAHSFKEFQFVIAAAPSINKEYYSAYVSDNIKIVYNQTYSLLSNAKAAIVCSGTATLETALFNVPQVVCYKGGKISYHIAKRIIKVKFISLVNLISDKLVVKELIQDEMTAKNISEELNNILSNNIHLNNMLNNYNDLKLKLGNEGASERAAKKIQDFLKP